MQSQLHLNLQQKAALSAATSFWEKKEIKNKVTEFFRHHNYLNLEETRNKWRQFSKAALEESKKDFLLPLPLEAVLIYIMKEIGEKIYNWYRYIQYKREFQFEENKNIVNYVDRIFWTPYGTVDEFKMFWFKHIKSDSYSDLIEYFELPANEFRKNNLLHSSYYDEDCSVEENILWFTVYEGYSDVLKYFWEKLTKEEKNKNLLICTRLAVAQYKNYADHVFKREKYIEICIFLMNQMAQHHKRSFFNENPIIKDQILNMLLTAWPWHEFLIPVLDDMLQYQEHDSEPAWQILREIMKKMIEDHKLGYAIKNSKYQSILCEFWDRIPESIKQKKEYGIPYLWNMIDDLIEETGDLDSIILIFNDPKMTDIKDQYMRFKNSR